ncbi:TlpA family protein disulfide reductase [Luteolibacter ambystomatis]|uniref:TlpA family protein disulfide reductase n=1 Tax=Luteolibacter ambystomatis TaxID=2824561 RepID=A0A975G8Y3_9BACT|nr:TlpA disulfide reductase family protein [Luteolibacter ambystomatis]QUE50485.1 TlpA family protein disulfide reductase [Luteolibacter ambystomatis]
MKSILIFGAIAAMVSTASALQAGDRVTPEALGQAKFVQGSVPKEWEPGKLYFIECWATWCGPCIASIPHVNELHKKYSEKGLRVIGLNVWDDGPYEKVEKFVKAKGEGMSYPVAFVGKGGAFETSWLKPAGVTGIPHTFLVRDGKLLATQHPGQLTDEVIGKLLAGGDGEAQALGVIAQQKADRAAETQLYKDFRAAQAKKDTAAMAQAIQGLEKYDSRGIPNLRFDLARTKGDWNEVKTAVAGFPDDATALMPLGQFAAELCDETRTPGVSDDLRREVAAKIMKAQGGKPGRYYEMVPLAALQAKAGDKEAALKTAKVLIANPGDTPAAVMTRYTAEVDKGEVPSLSQFLSWVSEERKAAAAKQ